MKKTIQVESTHRSYKVSLGQRKLSPVPGFQNVPMDPKSSPEENPDAFRKKVHQVDSSKVLFELSYKDGKPSVEKVEGSRRLKCRQYEWTGRSLRMRKFSFLAYMVTGEAFDDDGYQLTHEQMCDVSRAMLKGGASAIL